MSEKTARFVYADNAATTPVSPEVLEAMLPFLKEKYGNPSSLYSVAREAASAVEDARAKIAGLLGAKPNEIYFTASGSEADNWAIKGAARANMAKGRHIVTSKIEHHAVLHTCEALEKEGFEVTYLPVDSEGIVDPDEFRKALRPDTVLAAIMYANNEIGTIQPIKELAAIAHERKIPFFTDAVQAVGHIPVNVAELGVDMLALSGHKINAPKGIGALYIKAGTRIKNLIDGGGQERGRRAGTENVPYIVGLARALEIAFARIPELERVRALRDRLIDGILSTIPYSRLNGSREKRLPGNVNVAFEFIEGESLVLLLDSVGICASTGSACSTASLEPSHVLLAIGLPHEKAHGSLRLSLSHENTDEDVDYILEKLPPLVERLRAMSPLYEEFMRGEKIFKV
ncbi:MAG TPA: cysteine desulfurase NifS [Bacillota bacterium]|nr:cysteine desulfurase NifS [Clostridiales bacterium]HPT84499.1 cysteine desulfurase NifS [Bacillota bacterium]